MSKLSYISKSYGKAIDFAVANCDCKTLLEASGLPSNKFIITSPVSYNNGVITDNGTNNIFMTDIEGTPVRLTYHITLENGLTLNETNNDCIQLNIDNKLITSNSQDKLQFNIKEIIDNKSIVYKNDKLSVDISNLPIATENIVGVVKVNNDAININDDDCLYVNTQNLLLSSFDTPGIVKPDNKTIVSNNGILSAITNELDICTSSNYGIILPDSNTINITNGILSANTNTLIKAASGTLGIAKADNNSIIVNDGIYSVGTLRNATNTQFGLVKPDGVTMKQNDGIISVYNEDTIKAQVESIKKQINYFNTLTQDSVIKAKDTTTIPINTFMCNQISSAVLSMPKFGTSANEFTSELINVEIIVNTNCAFYLNFIYDNNVSPEIYVKNIFYNNLEIDGTDYNKIKFQSTNGENIIMNIIFVCKNFASVQNVETKITNVTITISDTAESSIEESTLFSIVRFNSLYKSELITKPSIVQITEHSGIIPQTTQVGSSNSRYIEKTV